MVFMHVVFFRRSRSRSPSEEDDRGRHDEERPKRPRSRELQERGRDGGPESPKQNRDEKLEAKRYVENVVGELLP